MDGERTREASWCGSESARREQGACEPPRVKARVQPRYLVPAGTGVWVRPVSRTRWQTHTTTKDCGFERYECCESFCYTFRDGGWVMKVYCKNVVVREDVMRERAFRGRRPK